MSKTNKLILIIVGFVAMFAIGIFGKGAIDESGYARAKLFNTAVQATEDDVFNYAVDSRQGNVLASGTFTAKDPVEVPDVSGTYYTVEKHQQKYNRHTETYECGSDKHPKTCTRVYYSWDGNGTKEFQATTVIFHKREYASGLFAVGMDRELTCKEVQINCDNGYSYKNKSGWFGYSVGDIRWYYEVKDITFSGTIIVNTSEGTLKSLDWGAIVVMNKDIPTSVKDANNIYGGTLFLVLWIISAIIAGVILIKANIIDQ